MRLSVNIFALTLLSMVALARPAGAQSTCDDAVRQLIEGVLKVEYQNREYDSAIELLQMVELVCPGDTYSKKVRAELRVAIGTIRAAMGRDEDAQKIFLAALKDDPDIELNPIYTNQAAEEAFRHACSNSTASALTIRLTGQMSGYTDTNSRHVLSPSVAVDVEHATGGWGGGARFLVDVISNASPDIVTTASLGWGVRRYAPAIHGHKKFGALDLALAGSLSLEPNNLSVAAGFSASMDLAHKMVTPSLGYQYSHDGLSHENLPKHTSRHAISVGLGLVLSKATFGAGLLTMVFEDGDQSGPDRNVPIFSPAVAAQVPKGASWDLVYQHGARYAPEHLPLSRKRFGLAVRVTHRFANATLRVRERGYYDSWGVLATTTDGRVMFDVANSFRLWPHLRVHYQGNAWFYRLAYAVRLGPTEVTLPDYRTVNPELGEMLGISAGGGARYDFGERRGYGLMFNGDFVSTLFLNHLFIKRRFGFFGTLTFVAEFE